MKRVLVTGAGGFLGARIMQQWQGEYELFCFPKGFLTVAEEKTILAEIQRIQPDVILHTAALSDTGYCAQHPEEAYRANVLLSVWMTKAAKQVGAKLIAISSDQVYVGVEQTGALPETLELCPTNVYGRYKLEAEQRVMKLDAEAVLLRASWMYDLPGYGLPIRGNLPLNLLGAVLRTELLHFSRNDYRGVTYVRQAVELLKPAIQLPGGVYNFGSENTENMVATAQYFAKVMGLSPEIQVEEWHRNLLMDNSRIRDFGIWFDTTQQGIRRCLQDYGLKE